MWDDVKQLSCVKPPRTDRLAKRQEKKWGDHGIQTGVQAWGSHSLVVQPWPSNPGVPFLSSDFLMDSVQLKPNLWQFYQNKNEIIYMFRFSTVTIAVISITMITYYVLPYWSYILLETLLILLLDSFQVSSQLEGPQLWCPWLYCLMLCP